MLDLGHQTVRTYRKTLMRKLGATNIAELVSQGRLSCIRLLFGPGAEHATRVSFRFPGLHDVVLDTPAREFACDVRRQPAYI